MRETRLLIFSREKLRRLQVMMGALAPDLYVSGITPFVSAFTWAFTACIVRPLVVFVLF